MIFPQANRDLNIFVHLFSVLKLLHKTEYFPEVISFPTYFLSKIDRPYSTAAEKEKGKTEA
jgi:hypothetical protein